MIMKTDTIRTAVLEKAQVEADEITANARLKAEEMITRAKEQKKKQSEEEKNRIIAAGGREASRILAQSSLTARREVLREKDAIINDIITRVKNDLRGTSMDEATITRLIDETMDAFETEGNLRLLVSPRDSSAVRTVVEKNPGMKERITEIVECECLGGVMAESIDGMVSIDNTFDMRLDMLIPKILPRIGRELFGDDDK